MQWTSWTEEKYISYIAVSKQKVVFFINSQIQVYSKRNISLLVGFMKWLAQKQIKGYFRYKNKCIPFPYPFIFWKRKPCNCQVNWICVYKLVWWNIQYFLRKKRTKLTTTTKQESSYCNNQAYKVLGNSDLKF